MSRDSGVVSPSTRATIVQFDTQCVPEMRFLVFDFPLRGAVPTCKFHPSMSPAQAPTRAPLPSRSGAPLCGDPCRPPVT
eukprot:371638-Rhodomonas_salina.2